MFVFSPGEERDIFLRDLIEQQFRVDLSILLKSYECRLCKQSTQPPIDLFTINIDGQTAQSLADTGGFEEIQLSLSPGPHTIDMTYQYNPFNLVDIPPWPPEVLGAVWIEDVSIDSLAIASPTEIALTSPESQVWLHIFMECSVMLLRS